MRFFPDALRCANPAYVPCLNDRAKWRRAYTVMLVVIQKGTGENKGLVLCKHFSQSQWTLLRKEQFNVRDFPMFESWHRAHHDYDARACDTNDEQIRLLNQSGLIADDEPVHVML